MTHNQDTEHLRLLSIFHYVVGGIGALFSFFPLIHVAFGIAMVSGGLPDMEDGGPPPELGWFFIGIAATIVLFGLTMSAFVIYAGRCLGRQTGYIFCFVIACLECLSIPFGTILGVFTLVVLSRPSVKERFESVRMGEEDDIEW